MNFIQKIVIILLVFSFSELFAMKERPPELYTIDMNMFCKGKTTAYILRNKLTHYYPQVIDDYLYRCKYNLIELIPLILESNITELYDPIEIDLIKNDPRNWLLDSLWRQKMLELVRKKKSELK